VPEWHESESQRVGHIVWYSAKELWEDCNARSAPQSLFGRRTNILYDFCYFQHVTACRQRGDSSPLQMTIHKRICGILCERVRYEVYNSIGQCNANNESESGV